MNSRALLKQLAELLEMERGTPYEAREVDGEIRLAPVGGTHVIAWEIESYMRLVKAGVMRLECRVKCLNGHMISRLVDEVPDSGQLWQCHACEGDPVVERPSITIETRIQPEWVAQLFKQDGEP
jgi:hypothetical protein